MLLFVTVIYISRIFVSTLHAQQCATFQTELQLQVLHEPDLDYGSSCVTFANCLGLIADWHNANPNHFPIILLLNQKVQGLADFLGDEGQRLLTSVMETSQTSGPDGYVTFLAFTTCITLLVTLLALQHASYCFIA